MKDIYEVVVTNYSITRAGKMPISTRLFFDLDAAKIFLKSELLKIVREKDPKTTVSFLNAWETGFTIHLQYDGWGVFELEKNYGRLIIHHVNDNLTTYVDNNLYDYNEIRLSEEDEELMERSIKEFYASDLENEES